MDSQDQKVSSSILVEGASVGRYVVAGRLGQGGMGAVYSAYDPELNREVALKILLAQEDERESPEIRRARLQREAQALAKLNHPNIVAVYDVGTFGERVFVAMELVAGQTFDEWLKTTNPPRRQVIEKLIAAGRGLCAAHQSGLVHRDFKPKNIIVSDSGEVKVLDFGLARAAQDELSSSGVQSGEIGESDQTRIRSPSDLAEYNLSDSTSNQDLLASNLTAVGAVMGTPLYMSPEQMLGFDFDERSDQFVFGVVMYEALFGEHPFRQRKIRALYRNVASGRIVSAADSGAPQWLRKITRRCLRADPEERYGSMQDVLDALENDPAIKRRKVLSTISVLAAVAVAFIVGPMVLTDSVEICAGADQNLVSVWDEPSQQRLAAAFEATGSKFSGAAYTRVSATMEQLTQKWVEMHNDACAATHVRKVQSEHLLDLRMLCLKSRLARMRAFVEIFSKELDAEMMDRAITASRQLGNLDRCADEKALLAQIPPPEDPEIRKIAATIVEDLANAEVLEEAGQLDAANQLAQSALDRANGIADPHSRASALLRKGTIDDKAGRFAEAEQRVREAIEIAEMNQDALMTAHATARLSWIVGISQNRIDDAKALQRPAELALHLGGGDIIAESNIENAFGVITMGAGDYSAAEAHLQKALELRIKAFGKDAPNVGKLANNLGRLYELSNRSDRAIEYYKRAIDIWRRGLGENHILVAGAMDNLGVTLAALGKTDEAIAYETAALAIREVTLGKEHADVALSLSNLGSVYLDTEKPADARSHSLRALEIYQKYYGKDEHLDIARVRYNLGCAALDAGDLTAAHSELEKSRAISEQVLGPEHPLLAYPLAKLAEAYFASKRHRDAEKAILRVVAICESRPCPPGSLGATHFVYAQLLAVERRSAVKIGMNAQKAIESYRVANNAAKVEIIEGWLKNR